MNDQTISCILKIVVMICFFIIVMVFGTLPLRSTSFKKRPLLRALGTTFAGCLFLNVAILHILPQAADGLQEYLRKGNKQQEVFPLAYLLMMIGFIITVFFTKVVSFHSHDEDLSQVAHDHNLQVEGNTHTQPIQNGHKHQQQHQQKPKIKSEQPLKSQKSGQPQILQSLITNCEPSNEHIFKSDRNNEASNNDHENKQQVVKHLHHQKKKSVLSEALILTVAIYFHTIFQGIAIGVQSTISGFLSIAVAIGFHKWADALSMGCHYRTKNLSKRLSYILIIGQAILNIGAIGLGWVISQQSNDVVENIFLSLSAGTFLAISTIEMLGQQLHNKKYIIIKFMLLIGATGFVSLIWFIQNKWFPKS